MSGRKSRSHRSIAAILGISCLALAACSTPAGTAGPSAEQSDPVRGPCGGAIVAVVWHAADPGIACASIALASGSPWPVSIRAAAQAFRDFTGKTSMPLEVTGPTDIGGARVYGVMDQEHSIQWLLSGSVDADTGRVTSMDYTPRAVGDPGPRSVSKTTAITTATEFLATHSVDVAGLAVSVAPNYRGWEITWERMIGDVGVNPRVTVTVEWQAGSVVGFAESVHDLGAPPIAVITAKQAEAAAAEATWLTSPVIEATHLRLEPYGAGGPALCWEIYLSGQGDYTDGPTYIVTRVDALTGQLD
jgi:hypothetical protein